jgi:prepilin-type N-terminal cleavage/methylation domain-containing protein
MAITATLLAGRASKRRIARATGVTLMEMLIVMMLLSLMVGITYPSVSAGLDSIRLHSAADSTVSYLNAALDRAERRQQGVEILIDPPFRRVQLTSADGRFHRELILPDGVRILGVLPDALGDLGGPRQFFVLPGGSVPRIGVVLGNDRGGRLTVRIDPITGAPQIEKEP